MKTILINFLFGFMAFGMLAQSKQADTLLFQLEDTKSYKARIQLMHQILYEINGINLQNKIDYSKKILDLSKKQKDKILESIVTSELAYILAIYKGANLLQATELCYNALEMAQETQNTQALGIIYNNLAVCLNENPKKQLEYYHKGMVLSEEAKDYQNESFCMANIASSYLETKQKDSALYYGQRSYEICLAKNLEYPLPFSLYLLANIHYNLYQDKAMARQYMQKAMRTKFGQQNTTRFFANNIMMSKFFWKEHNKDSALYYIGRANARIKEASLSEVYLIHLMYKKIYVDFEDPKAFKYIKLAEIYKDSLDKNADSQQIQLLTIKKDLEYSQKAEERQNNLQYAFITLGIITFLTLFLLISRTIVVNEKWISFFGILGLLIVFEFINLLIHPFLEEVTHHSPILMLLCLVVLASLLIPLHHKLEHWIKEKMTEKNKAIRLANAKKTIKDLEQK